MRISSADDDSSERGKAGWCWIYGVAIDVPNMYNKSIFGHLDM